MTKRRAIAYLTNDPGFSDDYQGEIRLGIEKVCREHDIDLWVYAGRTNWSADMTQRCVYGLIDPSRIDGIILSSGAIASHYSPQKVLNEVHAQCPVPTICIGQYCEGVSNILVDNKKGSAYLAEHLARVHGYRKYAYISGPRTHDDSRERLEGTASALSRYGISLDPEAIRYGDFSIVLARAAMRDLLRHNYGFDVVIAASDDMAMGAIEVLRAEGIHCPVQIAVVGFDDSPSSRLCQPALTTVRQPMLNLGATAVAQIIDMWRGREVSPITTLGTQLVVRESCGCAPRTVYAPPAEEVVATKDKSADELVTSSLEQLIDNEQERRLFAGRLLQALRYEQGGVSGSLGKALDDLVSAMPGAHLPIYELQGVLTALFSAMSLHKERASFEDVLRNASALVAMHAYRRPALRQLRGEFLLNELCGSWDLVSTALSLHELEDALGKVLPRIGILAAFIAYHPGEDHERLVPLVYIKDGSTVALPVSPYDARMLVPDGVFSGGARRSLTVMPLTYRAEQLGVAVFDFPEPLEMYAMLREQMSSALKVIRMRDVKSA